MEKAAEKDEFSGGIKNGSELVTDCIGNCVICLLRLGKCQRTGDLL